MIHTVTVFPGGIRLDVPAGANLLHALRQAGIAPDAPCGGSGTCGKCTVRIDGQLRQACGITVDRDISVTLPASGNAFIHAAGIPVAVPAAAGYRLAFDIGTTTAAGVLLDGIGQQIGVVSAKNPQAAYGADVMTRIRASLGGAAAALTAAIRTCLHTMTLDLCRGARLDPGEIRLVTVVGNPAMRQIFLGLSVDNLAHPPFLPVLTEIRTANARDYLPCLSNAELLILPDISGFVGADTLACVLSTEMDRRGETVLLVDIGTNGEIVLCHRGRMTACATAAGPALEGANISIGMTAQTGAIHRAAAEEGRLRCHALGGGDATGICGSGLISAVSAALALGWLNPRGKILLPERVIPLTKNLHLTQEDIRQFQLAKGAIAAGIRLLAQHMGLALSDIQQVYLAGAFGSALNPGDACRTGLLPPELAGRITSVGNAALSGATLLSMDPSARTRAAALASGIAHLNLSTAPDFPKTFARSMTFIVNP